MGRERNNQQIDRTELESLAFDIIYVIEQCLSFFIWEYRIMPGIQTVQSDIDAQTSVQVIKNATLEATLMFVRKLNAFFTSQKQNRECDDVYAFDFPGFRNAGWFLTKEQVDELNLRVGHITLREARKGKKQWPVADWVNAGMEKSISFVDYLLEDYFEKDTEQWHTIANRRAGILRHIEVLNSITKPNLIEDNANNQSNEDPAL